MLCIAEYSCFSLHARLYATVVVSASPEALQPSKEAMRWQVGNGQMPHLIYPQATGTRPIFLTSRENKFVPISLASAKANRARLATGLAFARKLVPL